jgi:magnesium transporter
MEDVLCEHPIPKVSVYGEQVFVAARTARLEGEEFVYGEICVFLARNVVITVRKGSDRAFTELRRHLEASPTLLNHGVAYVLYSVLDFIVDGYQPIIEDIEEEVLAIERRALDAFLSREDVIHLFNLRQELMRFRRVLGPMEEVCARLEHLRVPPFDEHIRPYFRDVGDHLRRVAGSAEALRDVLSSVFEVSNLFEQQRQGEITRRLAAWAGILAVPTAVAGIYGMNFEDMPELHLKYGYYAVLAFVVVICVVLYWGFRRAKWL